MSELSSHKGIKAIYPPTEGLISLGCDSCYGNVRTDCGFVEGRKYLCRSCAVTAIGSTYASKLLEYSQNKWRKNDPRNT